MHMQGSGRTGQALHYLDKRVSHQIQKLISTQLTQLSMMKQRYSVFLNDKHNTSEGFLHQKCVLGKSPFTKHKKYHQNQCQSVPQSVSGQPKPAFVSAAECICFGINTVWL